MCVDARDMVGYVLVYFITALQPTTYLDLYRHVRSALIQLLSTIFGCSALQNGMLRARSFAKEAGRAALSAEKYQESER